MAWALVTGASVGLGAEFARQIAAELARTSCWCRGTRGLGVVAREVEALRGRGRGPCRRSLAAARRRASDRGASWTRERPVDLLVNNAGFGFRHGFLESSEAELDDSLEVMVRAVMILSRAAAEAMASRGGGTIVNVSSIAAILATGTYAAHKAWVSAFTEGLASELRGTGVTATAVCPGLVRTQFHERAALDFSAYPSAVWLDSRAVVRSALRAARRGRVIVTPGARYGAVMAIARVLPRRWIRRAARARVRARASARPRVGDGA